MKNKYFHCVGGSNVSLKQKSDYPKDGALISLKNFIIGAKFLPINLDPLGHFFSEGSSSFTVYRILT